MCFQAVIFDLDGTLLNTIEDLKDAMNAMLRDFAFPEKDLLHHRKAVGSGVRNYVKNCMPQDQIGDEDLVTRCVEKMKECYGKTWNAKTHPYDGILELLQFLTHKGMILNVLSNKVDAATKGMVQAFFPEFDFSYVYGERVNVPRKPDPAAALSIAEGLNLKPSEILFVGDSSFDMLTAKNAGMYGVGTLWGYQSKQTLLESGAKVTISNPRELIDLIQNK